MLFERAGHELQRHATSRESGVPTLTTLVGDPLAARRLLTADAASRATYVATPALPDRSVAVGTWFAAALEGRDPRAIAAEYLARRTALPARSVYEHFATTPHEWPDRFDAATRDRSVTDLCRRLGGTNAGVRALIERTPGVSGDGEALEALRAGAEIVGRRSPTLVFDAAALGSESMPAALATAASIAEAATHVPVALCLTASDFARLVACDLDERRHALAFDGRISIDDFGPRSDETSAPSPPQTVSNALADTPDDLGVARSAAESALFAALERHPVTRGCFVSNGTLPWLFHGQPAEIDLLARRERVAVEVDGFWHFANLDAYRRDRSKDALLQHDGFIILRVLAGDVMTDADRIADDVARTMALRAVPRMEPFE